MIDPLSATQQNPSPDFAKRQADFAGKQTRVTLEINVLTGHWWIKKMGVESVVQVKR